MKKSTTKEKEAVEPPVLQEEPKEEPLVESLPNSTQQEAKTEGLDKPAPRFHGDPSHAQSLLQEGKLKEAIKYAAEHGYHRFVDTYPIKEGEAFYTGKNWDYIGPLNRCLVCQMVNSIITDPHAEPYASLMPANGDRKAYRALDDALRDALGFARYRHG